MKNTLEMNKYIHYTLLQCSVILFVSIQVSGQGFEENLYNLQSADLITEVGGDTFLINSSLNQFHLIGRHGEVLENILHSNNEHPDDIYVGEDLLDMAPYPMGNGDIAFFTRKVIDESLGKSDILYFNYRDADSKTFTVQTTLFLPEQLPGISDAGRISVIDYTFLDNHFYCAGLFNTTAGETYPALIKIDLDGEIVWAKTYLLSYSINGEISRIRAIETTDDDRVLLALEYADYEYYHLEVDQDGVEVGGSYFPLADDLSVLQDASKTAYMIQPDGGLIIVGLATSEHDLFVFDANANLVFSRDWIFGAVDVTQLYRIIRQVDGGFIVYRENWVPVAGNRGSITISKIDLAGNNVWVKNYFPDHRTAIFRF
jgi:hypothetical protein